MRKSLHGVSMAISYSSVWQTLIPAGTFPVGVVQDAASGAEASYRAALPDGRLVTLPIRQLPGAIDQGLASLIINQASFEVIDAFAGIMAANASTASAEVVIGVPTLGLALAPEVARRLGHSRYVPLGTSHKFWYDEALSVPLSSITTPSHGKSLFIDPRMLSLIDGRRVVVVDDVVSTGRSMSAALRLLAKIGCEPVALSVAMIQSDRWQSVLATIGSEWPSKVHGVIRTPLLTRDAGGCWRDAFRGRDC